MGRINESIWGAADTWPAASGTFSTVGKVANFNNQGTNLYTAVNQNILTFSQKIDDKSLSWCGLGPESNYGHIKIFANSTDDVSPNDERFVDNQTITNFFFYNIPEGDNAAPQNCIMTGNNQLYIWDTSFTMQNANLYIQPFTDFYIKKIVWLVQVSCSDTITGTIYTFDYNNYIANYKTTYPVIRYISAIPYKETNDNPLTRGTFSGNYPCTMKPAIFNGYSVYTNVPTDTFADYAIFSEDRDYSLLLFGSKAQNSNNRYTIAIGDCKRKYTSPRSTYQDTYIDDVLESALKTIACFGFFFILDSAYINEPLDSDNVYMGVIPDGGITHGEYTHGSANRDNTNWNMENTSTSTYDYKATPIDYSNNSDLTSYYLSTGFTRLYAVDITDMDNLSTAFSTAVQNLSTDVNDVEKAFFTNNPLDCVVSLKYFPFKLSKIATFANTTIKLGNNDTGITSEFMAGLVVPYPFGETYIPQYFGDFRDIEPYTTLDLVVPFCGSVRLSPSIFCGHTLRLKMAIDLFTGACCCYIFRDNLIVDSISGNCSIDLPVSGIQAADLNNAIMNAMSSSMLQKISSQQNIKQGALTGAGLAGDLALSFLGVGGKGGKSFNTKGLVSSAFSGVSSLASSYYNAQIDGIATGRAQYELENIQTPFNIIGSASAACSLMQEMNARLIIHRPKMDSNYTNDPTSFGNVNGYATLTSGTLSSFTGLTVCAAVDVSGLTASNEEINMIKKALLQGVRIKPVTP